MSETSDAVRLHRVAQALSEERQRRCRLFPDVNDRAWGMLLSLYLSQRDGPRYSVSTLLTKFHTAPNAGYKYLSQFDALGLIERTTDHLDKRRVWIRLSDRGMTMVRLHLEAIPTW